jgi:hypothetical protein
MRSRIALARQATVWRKGRSMVREAIRSKLAGSLALLALGTVAAKADDMGLGQLIACTATRADASSVSLDNLRFGSTDTYAWASARVHLSMRDGTIREYVLHGRADPIDKLLPPNRATPGFAYADFACRVQSSAITSVHNCHGSRKGRTCEVGIDMFGSTIAYSVSLTAERTRLQEATLP